MSESGNGSGSGGLERQLFLLRAYAALTYPFACVPFLYFYFADHGIGLEQYSTMISVYYLSMVVAEVPTGVLADRYGKKPPMVLGPLLLALGFLVVLLGDDFAWFCAGQAIFGLGHSVLSGPPAAILFETLSRHERGEDFLHQESIVHGIRLGGTGVSFLLGGLVAEFWGIDAAILLTVALCALCGVLAMLLREPRSPRSDRQSAAPPLLRTVRGDLAIPAVRWLIGYYLVLFTLLRFPFHTYQPFLQEVKVTAPWFVGTLFFALNMLAAPCSRAAPWLQRTFGTYGSFLVMPLSLAITLLLMGGRLDRFGIFWFFAHQIPFGMHWAVVQSWINHRIRDQARATVLSVVSVIARGSFVLLFPLTTYLSGGDVGTAYLGTGALGLVATVCMMLLGRRHFRPG